MTRTISWCALLSALLWAGAALGQLDSDQQKCLNTLNKDVAKLAATQGKENAGCLKRATHGTLESGQTADACLLADGKGKIADLQARIADDYAELCAATPPPIGLPSGTVAAIDGTVPRDQSLSLLADIFGASLTTAAIDCDADSTACGCQYAVAQNYEKLAKTAFKVFTKCKKTGLKTGSTSATIENCIDDPGTVESILSDSKQKIAKRVAKLTDAIAKKCPGVNTAVALPGLCAGRTGAALADCLNERVQCRVCLTLNLVDNVAADCDAFDDGQLNLSCPRETFTLKSPAEAADTPGTAGLTAAAYPKLVTQFGGSDVNLNNAMYTRFRLSPTATEPDAILILVPGFEGGANDFKVLAENLIPRVLADDDLVLEVWAYDRRSNQLEDTLGLDIAEANGDAQIGLDWLFGGELALTLSPELAAGPNRRAQFHNTQADTAFIAGWTGLTFSRDIDAIVEKARTVAKNGNVFLGGHSAGTGFAARYAATDFNLTGTGPAQPGYAKLRGIVLLEGPGGSTAGAPLTNDTLDRIEAKFDGGLFGAVRDNAGRCVNGTTPCALATEAADCIGQTPPKCTLPTGAYAVSAILNARILAAVEPAALQGLSDPDTGQILLQVDQGSPGNKAITMVPDLAVLGALPQATVYGGIGTFIDDDGPIAGLASFVATSVGAPGPIVGPLQTWLDLDEGPLPPAVLPNNGPPPTTLPGAVWGQEKEVTRFDRMITTFFAGHSNFTDWYYPSSGLSVTSVAGVCTSSVCTTGNVGAACTPSTAAAVCGQSINLDSSALSVGRGRRDIENLTQAAGINIPVIGFGGSNGLAPVPGRYTPFAQSIGVCTAPSCNGAPRVVDASTPNPAFPTFGDVNGGFEVYINEGFAHVDVLTAEDDANNNVLAPLSAFIDRNVQ
jgi:pimeloyl-ACP methyl ester carboxylesterase